MELDHRNHARPAHFRHLYPDIGVTTRSVQNRTLSVPERNHVRPYAQSSPVSNAHWLRLEVASDARYLRLSARSLRLARDHKSRHTIIETERTGEGRLPIVGIRGILIAAILLLSELFGPVSLVSLDLAR